MFYMRKQEGLFQTRSTPAMIPSKTMKWVIDLCYSITVEDAARYSVGHAVIIKLCYPD